MVEEILIRLFFVEPAHNNKMAKAALEVLGPDVEEGLPGAEQEEVGAAA